ncbi:MAG: hypothetical protein ACHREM_23585 [Polyangiales bacterium]
MRLARIFTSSLFAALALVPATACGRSEKASDCERLVPAVREKSDELHTALSNVQPDPTSMDARAKVLEASAALIAAMPMKDTMTKSYATQYQATLLSGAKLIRDLGSANPDPVALATTSKLQASSAGYLLEEAKLVGAITEYCH